MHNKMKRLTALLMAVFMLAASIPVFASDTGTGDTGEVSLHSLLPLEEVNATVDLSKYLPAELENVKVSEILKNMVDEDTGEAITIAPDATTVWSNFFDENGDYVYNVWEVTGMDGTVNVQLGYYSSRTKRLEMIIGSGKQLDPKNKRYHVEITFPDAWDVYELEVYEQTAGADGKTVRSKVECESFYQTSLELENKDGGYTYVPMMEFDVLPKYSTTADYYVNLSFDKEAYPGYEMRVFKGMFDSAEEALKKPSAEITKFITGQKMTEENAGYKEQWLKWEKPEMMVANRGMTVVFTREGKAVGSESFVLHGSRNKNSLEANSFYTLDESGAPKDVANTPSSSYDEETQAHIKMYTLQKEYAADQEYYFTMRLYDYETEKNLYDSSKITKAVVGHYDSLEAAEAQPDIKDQLFPGEVSGDKQGYKANYSGEGVDFTVFESGDVWKFTVIAYESFERKNEVYVDHLYTLDGEGNYVDVEQGRDDRGNSEYETVTYTMDQGYPANAEYSVSMYFHDGTTFDTLYDSSKITKAVVGLYDSIDEAASKPDIKDQLFPGDVYEGKQGYKANYSGKGVQFTVFVGEEVWKFKVIAKDAPTVVEEEKPSFNEEAPEIGSDDKDFRVTGVQNTGGEDLDTYIVPFSQDTYYSNGYQTLFVKGKDVDMTQLKPVAYISDRASVFHEGVKEEVESGYDKILSSQDFTKEPADLKKNPKNSVGYTVSAENHKDHKNYNLTIVKETEGAKLFVNGPDERYLDLNDYYNNVHDIFIANIGDQELKNLKVELTGAKNVKLDNYWTVGGEKNDTLAAFTTTADTWEGYLPNVAKIRLHRDGEGDISGKLKISAGEGENAQERIITLTGKAGNPKITTTSLRDPVKYVPYQSIVTTDNMYDWIKVTFEPAGGKLPQGVRVMKSGEIYGTPKELGRFTFKVRANYSTRGEYGGYDSSFASDVASITLNVKENTDANVNAEVDEGCEIITRVPNAFDQNEDQIFEFEYDYAEHADEFQGFWLDGEKLTQDIDYEIDKGSSKITIKSQTFSKAGKGKHTIAAEYRKKSTDKVIKAAQNYGKDKGKGNAINGGGNRGGSGSAISTNRKVWFEVNGGAWLDAVTVKNGETIGTLPTPERAGFLFGGWYKDKELTQAFDANEKITADTTLYAKWTEMCKLWFIENGGEPLEDMDLIIGEKASSLPTPVKEGYVFDGWYKDEQLTQPFDINEAVPGSMSLYAKWVENKLPDVTEGFRDVNLSDWFYADVDWVYKNQLMVGVGEVLFAPNEFVTSGMVVTVLARMAKVDASQYQTAADNDIYEGQWYTPYAKWAKAVGLVEGVPFNPPQEITREWMCTVLDKYLAYIGVSYDAKEQNVTFADENSVSEGARDAVHKLYQLGILRGRENNMIDPASSTTRAEFAAFIHRVNDFVNNKK